MARGDKWAKAYAAAMPAEQGAGGADPFARVWDNPEDAVYDTPLAPLPAPSDAAVREAAARLQAWLTPMDEAGYMKAKAEDVETLLTALSSPAAPATEVREAALAPIRGLRITATEIRAALKSVMPYGPGQRDEAFVQVAAEAAADSLATLSSPAPPDATVREAAEAVSQTYYEIAAEAIGEDKVKAEFSRRFEERLSKRRLAKRGGE